MNRVMSFLKKILHPTVFGILVLIILGFVIMYFGERMGMRGIYPFKTQFVKTLVVGLLWAGAAGWTLLIVVRSLIQYIRGRKTDRVKAEPTREELELNAFGEIFKRVTKMIRKRWEGKGRFKYSLPWYVVIGKKDAGKTSLIDNIGLRFPIDHEIDAETKEFASFDASTFTKWRVSGNEAVILDLQGEFFVPHEERTELQTKLWKRFLKLLQKYRPRRPLNGIILAIDAVEFFQMTLTEREDYALLVRRTVSDMVDELGTKLTVYVTFTKLDLVAGFNEYFEALKGEDRDMLFGFHFKYRGNGEEDWFAQFSEQQDNFLAALRNHIGDHLLSIRSVEARREAFSFYRTFFGIESPIKAFLEAALAPDKFSTAPLVRGVYFTSVRQENAPESVFFQSVGQRYALPAPLYGTRQGRSHPYFVNRLFNKVIFPEAALAGANQRVERLQRKKSLIAGVSSVAIISLLSIFWWRQYGVNINNAKIVESKVNEYVGANISGLSGEAQSEFLGPLNTIRDATQAFGNYREKNTLVSLATLYQGKRIGPLADEAYLSALNEVFVPSLIKDVEEKLKEVCPKGGDEELNLLRIYKMFGTLDGRDDRTIENYHTNIWQTQHEGNVEVQNYLNGHLQYALDYGPRAYDINETTVIDAQRNLAAVLPYKRVYSTLRAQAERDLVNPESFARAAGASFDLVYTKRDTLTIEGDGSQTTDDSQSGSDCGRITKNDRVLKAFVIPEFYTKKAFTNYFIPKSLEIPEIAASDLWVLGALSNAEYSEADYAAIENNIRAIYVDDYIQTWRTQLNGLQVHRFENLRDAIEVTKVLGSPDNPIRRIAALVEQDTNIYENVDDASIQGSASGSQLPKDANLVAGMEIKRAFLDIQKMTEAPSDDQQSKMNEIIAANAALYEYLKQIQDDANPANKALELAIERAQLKGDDPIYVLKRIADKLPAPFDKHMNQVAEDAWRVILNMASVALNEKWQKDIYGDYYRLIAGKYPFDSKSSNDLPMEDFQSFFSPEGIIDAFYKNELLVFVDEISGDPKEIDGQQLSVDPNFIEALKKSQQITKNFFDESGNVNLNFTVSPISMDNNVLRGVLNVEGQIVSYAHGPQGNFKIAWPNVIDGVIGSRVDLSPVARSGGSNSVSASGPWSFIRLLSKGQRVQSTNNSVDILFAPAKSLSIVWRFRSESSVNLFLDSPFDNFELPENVNATTAPVRNIDDVSSNVL